MEKLEAYQLYPTIQEILLVDSRRRYIEHYHRAGTYKWEEFLCDLYKKKDDTIELECIGVLITVQEIYHKVFLELEEEN